MESKKTVTVGEDSYGIRKLSWKSLSKAEEARTIAQIGNMRALGGELLKALRSEEVQAAAKLAASEAVAEEKAAANATKARYDAYDQERILSLGVESKNGVPFKPEEVDELDKVTAEILHRAIVDLSDPLPEVVEAEQGKS